MRQFLVTEKRFSKNNSIQNEMVTKLHKNQSIQQNIVLDPFH